MPDSTPNISFLICKNKIIGLGSFNISSNSVMTQSLKTLKIKGVSMVLCWKWNEGLYDNVLDYRFVGLKRSCSDRAWKSVPSDCFEPQAENRMTKLERAVPGPQQLPDSSPTMYVVASSQSLWISQITQMMRPLTTERITTAQLPWLPYHAAVIPRFCLWTHYSDWGPLLYATKSP